MRRAPFVRSFAYTECPLTGETEIEREANGGMAGCVWGWLEGLGGTGTEIERKERRMNEPQCIFFPECRRRGCEKEKGRGQRHLGQPCSGGDGDGGRLKDNAATSGV